MKETIRDETSVFSSHNSFLTLQASCKMHRNLASIRQKIQEVRNERSSSRKGTCQCAGCSGSEKGLRKRPPFVVRRVDSKLLSRELPPTKNILTTASRSTGSLELFSAPKGRSIFVSCTGKVYRPHSYTELVATEGKTCHLPETSGR